MNTRGFAISNLLWSGLLEIFFGLGLRLCVDFAPLYGDFLNFLLHAHPPLVHISLISESQSPLLIFLGNYWTQNLMPLMKQHLLDYFDVL